MAYLILVRHGQSEWNKKGLWTGFADPPLSEVGREEARRTADEIKGIPIDEVFTSPLQRMKDTVSIILSNRPDTLTHESDALKERNYGIYTGKNKWEVKKELGDESFLKLRRGWDCPIPEGESLKEVHQRVMPFYIAHILPLIQKEKNILVTGGGNILRSMIKHLENISEEKISEVEIGTGEAWIYNLNTEGHVLSKEIRAKNETKV